MTLTKIVLFALFAVLLSLISFAGSHAGTAPSPRAPSVFMQHDCPDGQEWSEEQQACVPEKPRGSF